VISMHGRVIGCRRVEREAGEVRSVTFRSLDGEVYDLPATEEAYEIARRALKNMTPLVLTLAEEGD
jgi:hypothetical protein